MPFNIHTTSALITHSLNHLLSSVKCWIEIFLISQLVVYCYYYTTWKKNFYILSPLLYFLFGYYTMIGSSSPSSTNKKIVKLLRFGENESHCTEFDGVKQKSKLLFIKYGYSISLAFDSICFIGGI